MSIMVSSKQIHRTHAVVVVVTQPRGDAAVFSGFTMF